MSYGPAGGKRQREAQRDRKKKEKEERLRRNRALGGAGQDVPENPADLLGEPEKLPEISLEQISISGVAPRGPKGSGRPTKLFVGGLSWDTGNDALQAAFAKFGQIVEAAVVLDRDTGRSRGFGFVTFENALEASEAAKQMNGAELDGRTLKVNLADRR